MDHPPQYSVTIDVDWAPDACIEYTRDVLDAAGVRATFFLTGTTTVDLSRHEQAIHPNLIADLEQGVPIRERLLELKKIVPNAVGVRGHCLAASTRFYPLFRAAGLRYESSHLCYGVDGLRPYTMIEGITQIPIYWEDDLHVDLGTRKNEVLWTVDQKRLQRPGVKVFVFHPIHVWTNMTSPEHYASFKEFYHQPDMLVQHRAQNLPGTGTFFQKLLSFLSTTQTRTLREIADTCE